MNPFILPPLERPATGGPWTSHVRLPPESEKILETMPKRLLPAIEKSYLSASVKKLSIWKPEPRFEDMIEALERQQRKLRATIGGREHECRYRLLWQHQEEKVIIECRTEAASVSELMRQRARYSQKVRDFEARGHVLHVETLTRGHIYKSEEDARKHIESLEAMMSLKGLRHKASRDVESAESILHGLCDVQEFERCVAQGSFHPSKIFKPVTSLIMTRNTGTGHYQGRTDLLMDYTVCDEECRARARLLFGERLALMDLYCEHNAVVTIAVEESSARAAMWRAFRWGRCQARLEALLIIQRWWRMLRVKPWLVRRKQGISECFRKKRWKMTASDYHALLSRMRRSRALVGGPSSLTDIRQSMAAVERAAELSHQWLYDYFVYTLMNRAAQLHRLIQHDLGIHSVEEYAERSAEEEDEATSSLPLSLLRMPYRVFVRMQAKQPYPSWRINRWVEGSISLMRLQEGLMAEESRLRDVLHGREARETDALKLFQFVLNKGDWPWRSFCTAMHFIVHDESIGRDLVAESERNARSTLSVEEAAEASQYFTLESERLYILQEEALRREAIEKEESTVFGDATEGEWRWENLCKTRMRFAASCGCVLHWERERDRGLGSKHVSLDSVARVITRFFRRVQRRRRLAAARSKDASEETRVREIASAMKRLLEGIIEEDKQLIPHYIAQFGAAATAVLSPVSTSRATELCSQAIGTQEDASYIDTSASLFSEWFDAQASEPMERNYKEIVARFIAAHKDLYRDMQHLFYIVRRVREGVEESELSERIALQQSEAFLQVATYQVSVCEEKGRLKLVEEIESAHLDMCEQLEMLGALAWCTTPSTRPKPFVFPLTKARKAKPEVTNALLPLPIYMTNTNRLLCREEVTRVRIAVEELREYKAYLENAHNLLHDDVVREEATQRLLLCAKVDNYYPSNPPVAQLAALVEEETHTRIPTEEEALGTYSSPMLRSVSEYAEHVLFKRFLQGFLKFSSEAQYFDRHVTVLLLQRVSFLGSKLRELLAMESCARGRLEFYEERYRDALREAYYEK
ncbi:uncharacterized protein TEOVI_000110500 [Trypanosoma equiperdum]|uniref:Uncharacterized protein n=2 Tax=Trypanozoon TaxID=39700 RepID=Q383F0_TRYB2|nr:hypothetical protein, conserved [Trypanosoma brucei brucei TREU927]EAN80081.1 hypothetical protein, conserved [Trypanosoma brucei brucei TREU927]SCU69539.1 hypothetical protein, conserved [Trypanosoma equiperdum]